MDSEDIFCGKNSEKSGMWVVCITIKTLPTGRNPLKNKDFLEILMKECEYIGKVIHKLSTFCG